MSHTDITWDFGRTPQAAKSLSQLLTNSPDITGNLIFGWPILPPIRGQKAALAALAVIISSEGQATAFDLIDGPDPGTLDQYQDRQDRAFNILTSQINLNPNLMHGRITRVPVHTVTFAPGSDRTDPDHPECPLVNADSLVAKITRLQASPPSGVSQSDVLKAVLQCR